MPIKPEIVCDTCASPNPKVKDKYGRWFCDHYCKAEYYDEDVTPDYGEGTSNESDE
jgi:hypothetical protein